MPLPKLKVPPGLYRVGTEYESAGRFYDSNLVRWLDGHLRPIGGWSSLNTGLTGTARDLHTWVDNSAVGRVAVGTNSNLYVLTNAGARTDITPVSGWTSQDAGSSTWTLDNAGQLLVGVNDEHGTLFTWLPGDAAAAALSNAPSCDAVAVTNEGIPVALGASGNPRAIAWCDRDDFTDWTAGFADLAGDLVIQASGTIQNAKRVRAGLLIWTTSDVHILRYVGLPNVYGVTAVAGGTNAGAVSRHAMVMVGDLAYWMSDNAFYACSGGAFISKVRCDIWDDVFAANTNADSNRIVGLNKAQAHKVRAMHNAKYSEIWWMYPKGAATENSHVAVYNYAEKTWSIHELVRTCGIEANHGFESPLMIGSTTLWEHESGDSRTGGGTVYARTGPVELGDGERQMAVRRVIPDEGTAGDVDVYFHTRPSPNATEESYGPFASSNPMDVRFTARQVAMEFRESSASDWRVGTYRVEMKPAGQGRYG